MLNIRQNRKIELALIQHTKALSCRLNKKIKNIKCSDLKCVICNSTDYVSEIPYKLYNLLSDSFVLETILSGVPSELIEINKIIWEECIEDFSEEDYNLFLDIRNKPSNELLDHQQVIQMRYKGIYESICQLFDYEAWFQNPKKQNRYDVYKLAFNLSRNTCTYCNRIYTSTAKDINLGKVMRAQIDHWFPQTRFPLLVVSFYNLIPSCSLCNSSIKNASEFKLATHNHPYEDVDISSEFVFSYDYSHSSDSYEIKIVPMRAGVKAMRLLNDLDTRNVYNSHQLELKDLILIKNNYSANYLNGLIGAFPDANLSHREIYRLAFGVELESRDYYKLPLSKFKKDILTELGII